MHPEYAQAHIQHLPREEKTQPARGREARRASTEDDLAPVARVVAASRTEIATPKPPYDENEGRQGDRADDETIG